MAFDSIMRDNNTQRLAILLFCFCILTAETTSSKKQTEFQDLDSILFHQESELNYLSI